MPAICIVSQYGGRSNAGVFDEKEACYCRWWVNVRAAVLELKESVSVYDSWTYMRMADAD